MKQQNWGIKGPGTKAYLLMEEWAVSRQQNYGNWTYREESKTCLIRNTGMHTISPIFPSPRYPCLFILNVQPIFARPFCSLLFAIFGFPKPSFPSPCFPVLISPFSNSLIFLNMFPIPWLFKRILLAHIFLHLNVSEMYFLIAVLPYPYVLQTSSIFHPDVLSSANVPPVQMFITFVRTRYVPSPQTNTPGYGRNGIRHNEVFLCPVANFVRALSNPLLLNLCGVSLPQLRK